MKSKIYDLKGKEAGTVDLPENIFGLELNNDLVHQVIVSMMSNQRAVISHTKGRGEVSGGGKKP
jgi:large subunit ribosomal protein L4